MCMKITKLYIIICVDLIGVKNRKFECFISCLKLDRKSLKTLKLKKKCQLVLTSSSVDLNEGVLSLKNTWSFSYLPYLNNDFSWKGYSITCISTVLYYVRRWLKLLYLNL